MQVPAVDAEELKKAWLHHVQATWYRPGVQLGYDLLVQMCKPGTDVDAVAARVWYLEKLVKEAIAKAATEPFDTPLYPLKRH